MMISFLLVAAALTAGSVLIGTAGDWVDEKTGRWRTGGLIAPLTGIAASTWITTTAPQAASQSAGTAAEVEHQRPLPRQLRPRPASCAISAA